jgi:hypothetical protein
MKKFLDLDELLDANKRIYVRNNALKARLFLIIEMKDKHGRSEALKVPETPVPICVSARFSKETIRESTDLRKSLAKGTLILVDQDIAERELQTDDAREEVKNLELSMYSDSSPQSVARQSIGKLNTNASPVVEARELLEKSNQVEEQISSRVRGILASFKSKEKNAKETLVLLKRLKTVLTKEEMQFIITECPNDPTIREFAENLMVTGSDLPDAEPETT